MKHMYNTPVTEVTPIGAENLMQGFLNPISSGGNASDYGNIEGDIEGD